MPKLDPDMVKGTDKDGHPIVYTRVSSPLKGFKRFRRMTEDEIDRYRKSKTGRVKIKPAKLEGNVPT